MKRFGSFAKVLAPAEAGNTQRFSRIAVVAVVLFLLFDFAALALNVWLSLKIEEQAVAINLVGRERMLSQRMVKALLEIEEAEKTSQSPAAGLSELKLTFDLFDNTLQTLAHGYSSSAGAGERPLLQPIKDAGAKKLVDEAVSVWMPYRSAVQALMSAPLADLDRALPPAVASAKQNNLKLLELMDQLTTAVESRTRVEARSIRIYQASAFGMALLNFFWAVWLYRRRIHIFDRSRNLLDDVINKVSAVVLVLDQAGVVIKANRAAEELFDYEKGGLAGLHIDAVVTGETDKPLGQRRDGTTFPAVVERNESALDGRRLCVVTVHNISEQRQTEERLSSLAYYDWLTGLPNRLLFDDRLQLEIAHAQRAHSKLAVLFIDLDQFKPVNDLYGHEMGDLLLRHVAARLRRCLRESDTLSRRSGDEFTAIATEVVNRQSCERIARLVLSQLSLPFRIERHDIKVGASIGISVFPSDGNTADVLVSRADEAMYRAKQAGRNSFRFYADASTQQAAA